MKLISRDAVLRLLDMNGVVFRKEIEGLPLYDYEQIRWERDIAVGQLESIGKSLGERMDDVKAKLSSPSGFEVLDELSAMYGGKQMYFEQDGGVIYSRYSGKNLPALQDAVNEFGKILEGEYE